MEIAAAVAAGLTFTMLIILFIRSAKEPLLSMTEVSHIRRPFRRSAVFLYKKALVLKRKVGKGLPLFEGNVREDLRTLDPSGQAARTEARYRISKIEDLLICLCVACILAASALIAAHSKSVIGIDGSIERETYGGAERELRIEEKNYGTFDITVGAREYLQEELEAMAKELEKELPELILGENSGLEDVESKLELVSSVEGYPFSIRWDSSNYGIIDSGGRVTVQELPEGETAAVELTATLTDGSFKKKIVIPVLAVSPIPEEREKIRKEIEEAISENESENPWEEFFYLPTAVGDRELSWKEASDGSALILFLLASSAGAAAYFLRDREIHKRVQSRERQMNIEYPRLVSKLVLYIGAGMSVRGAFLKIGNEYRKEKGSTDRKSFVCEEILLMCRELDGGISEAAAYTHFALRCRSRAYTKLVSLLTQNLRRGNNILLEALREEAAQSFEKRKDLARQLGEEAGTKLLLPMIMMLSVTMVIIMIPAYLGFFI